MLLRWMAGIAPRARFESKYADSNPHRRCDADRNRHACDSQSHLYAADPHRDSHQYAHLHAHSDDHRKSHSLSDELPACVEHAEPHVHAFAHAHTYADLHIHIHIHSDSLIHADPIVHPSADQHDGTADNHANAHLNPVPVAMTEILPFLKSLISASGVSGNETPVAKLIEEKWRPLVDETRLSRVGSLYGLKKGSGKGAAPSKSKGKRPAVLIAAHMDAIGMRVTQIVDGFLRITNVGGIDARVLPGAEVTVHASSGADLPAVIAMPPSSLLPESAGDGALEIGYLLADTGLTAREVEKNVKVGDLISFANEPMELAGDVLSGHTVDNRASVAALTVCLEELQSKPHVWDVWAVATVQEETSFLGGYTSAFEIRPDIAIAVDGTFAKGPGANGWQTHAMGKGVGLCMGPNIHPFLHKKLKELAERLEIPWFLDVTTAHSSTDADPMQVTAEGIPTALVEFPIRYMHTPVETVAVKDIQRAGRLLAEFIASLEDDFVETITWDE